MNNNAKHIRILSENIECEQQDHPDKYHPIQSGFKELDTITGKWQKGDLVVVAGRGGMGKTTLSLSMLLNMLTIKPIPTAIFYLEHTFIHLYNKLLCMNGIQSEYIENNSYKVLFIDNVQSLNTLPLHILTPNSINRQSLSDEIKKLVSEQHIQIIFIDYIQLVVGFGRDSSKELKALAKELNIVIIVLSQTSKASDKRCGKEGKRPMPSDLSNAGNLFDDADVICFLHRPDYFGILEDEKGYSLINVVDIIVAKNRHGRIGKVRLGYQSTFDRIIETLESGILDFDK